jgi:hypothetical protein
VSQPESSIAPKHSEAVPHVHSSDVHSIAPLVENNLNPSEVNLLRSVSVHSIDMDDTVANGVQGQICDRMQVEFAHQVGAMGFRCFYA